MRNADLPPDKMIKPFPRPGERVIENSQASTFPPEIRSTHLLIGPPKHEGTKL